MNPLKMFFTKKDNGLYEYQSEEEDNDTISGINIFGGIAWMGATALYWSSAGLFDSTAGRLGFLPALFIAWIIGFKTTLFLIGASVLFTLFGLVVGWIFDFPFFDTTLTYVAIAYQYLFK
jgi:hypothetical protein